MLQIAELIAADTLRLPPGVAKAFRASDRFIVWQDGETLVFKRISPPAVTEIVERAPEGEPLAPEDISEIVHEVRRKGRAG